MDTATHIEITPGTCSGRPRVAGTRIRVANVVLWSEQGQSPEEIIASYPQLTLADIHASLAFYFDNREEMNQLIADDQAFVATAQTGHAPVGTEADADPLSS